MRLSIGLLAGFMLIFGSLNTILTKLQVGFGGIITSSPIPSPSPTHSDHSLPPPSTHTQQQDTTVVGTDSHGKPIYFKHPAIQTAFMFMGESLCLVIYLVRRWLPNEAKVASTTEPHQLAESDRNVKKASFLFIIPALCDTLATTLLNLGLFYTYASAFQMLRGTMVIFAGFFTVVILKRSLFSHQWTGILLITVGSALVGAASVLMDINKGNITIHNNKTSPQLPSNPLLGNALVVLAQVFQAIQFIVEEKFLVKYHTPVLLAIGSEGIWGLLVVSLSLFVVRIPGGADGGRMDDLHQAVIEIRGNSTLQWSAAGSVLSIAVFNFFGVTVTKRLSGSARATIDACRTLMVWLVALQLGWEKFHFLSMVGFIVLLSGTSVYNEILKTRFTTSRRSHSGGHHHHRHRQEDDNEDASLPLLLNEDDDDNQQYDIESNKNNRATAPRVAFNDDHDIINPSSSDRNNGGGVGAGDGAGPSSSRRQQHQQKKKTVTLIQSNNRRSPYNKRQQQQEEYTMARSVTILPQALSPHSMASNPTPFPSSALLGSSSTDSDVIGSSSSSGRSRSGLSGEGGSDEDDGDGQAHRQWSSK